MRKIFPLVFFAFACASSNANAWFFFLLPGALTSKIGDAITGSEGDNCVGPNAKIGDVINLSNGNRMTVKSLSGTSSRCTNAEHPIRALLVPSTTVSPPTPSYDAVKEAEAKRMASEEEAKRLATEDAKRLLVEQEAKRLASEEEARRVHAAEEQVKRVAAEEAEANSAAKNSLSKVASVSTQQIDFNLEAGRAARILGCQPSELKVTGIDGSNIQYLAVCDKSRSLGLSCDQTGLCLQKKADLRQKK